VSCFATLKPTLAFGQVPLLQDGDFKLVQSNAILRHLARRIGGDLYGKNAHDHAHVDMILDGAEDLRARYLRLIYGDGCSDPAKATYLADYLPGSLAHFEKILAGVHGGKGYLVGDFFTVADASFFEVLDTQVNLSSTALDATPNLKAYHARVSARPNIAAYLASGRRPGQINGNGKGQTPVTPAKTATPTAPPTSHT